MSNIGGSAAVGHTQPAAANNSQIPVITTARTYKNANASQPRSYWDYDGFSLSWNSKETYQLVQKLGNMSTFQCSTFSSWLIV